MTELEFIAKHPLLPAVSFLDNASVLEADRKKVLKLAKKQVYWQTRDIGVKQIFKHYMLEDSKKIAGMVGAGLALGSCAQAMGVSSIASVGYGIGWVYPIFASASNYYWAKEHYPEEKKYGEYRLGEIMSKTVDLEDYLESKYNKMPVPNFYYSQGPQYCFHYSRYVKQQRRETRDGIAKHLRETRQLGKKKKAVALNMAIDYHVKMTGAPERTALRLHYLLKGKKRQFYNLFTEKTR